MKTYKEITAEINGLPKAKSAYERDQEYTDNLKEANHDIEKIKAVHKKYQEEYDAAKSIIERKKVLEHNARIALELESFPIIIEEMNNYAGKRIGEKTTDKIKDAIYEKCGIRIHFNDEYGRAKITIYYNAFSYNDAIYISAKRIENDNTKCYELYNEDGKLNTLSADMFDYDHSNLYIEDIDGYISRKKDELLEINKAVKALWIMIDKYNSDIIKGFNRADRYKVDDHNRLS